MRKIFLLALLLASGSASAQNPTCPTRPLGDSTNACASTAFVATGIVANYPPIFTSTTAGLVPASGGGTTNFLRADGTFAPTPAATPIANATISANYTGSAALSQGYTLTTILDNVFGTTRGSIIERGATVWQTITPGASGTVFTSNGVGADPSYTAIPVAPRSNVRQTVQGGPATAGAPSFLPTTSASLSLTAQNVSTGINALTIAAAAGFNATGPADIVTQLTANPTWSSLTASTTNYLWINASTGATGFSTLQPIYQFGGTIPTTSGQFTFDYQQMIGYVGNGTTAVVTPLVYVGEAVTSGSAVTSAAAYSYNGYYESPVLTTVPALATNTSYNSNLGVASTGTFDFSFQAATGGYAIGEKINNLVAYDGSATYQGPLTGSTRLTVSFTTSNSGSPLYYRNKATGALMSVAAGTTGVNIKLIQRRGWGGS